MTGTLPAPPASGRRGPLRLLQRYPNTALGLLGAALMCVGTYGVADLPRNDPLFGDLGLAPMSYGHGKLLTGLAFWLGIALMVIAWVRLGRELYGGRGELTVRSARWAVCVWAVPMMVAVPVFSRDVYAYLGQAALLPAGFDPYNDGPAHAPGPIVDSMAQIWASTTSPYGPAFLLLARGVVTVAGDNVYAGVFLMRLVLLPGLALSLWALPRIAGHFGANRTAALWLVLLNPLLLIHLLAGPHLELLMMGFLAAGVALVLTGRHVTGLLVLGLAISIKVTAAVAVPFMLWVWLDHLRTRRTAAAAAAPADAAAAPVTLGDRVRLFAATAVLPSAVFGVFTLILGLGVGWLNGLSWASRIINPFTIPSLAGHLVMIASAPGPRWNLQEVLPVARTIGSVVMVLLLIWLWWRYRSDERTAMAGAAWAMLAVLLLEPSTLPWYYVWALVPAIAFDLPMWTRRLIVGLSVYLLIVFQPDDSIWFYKPLQTLLAIGLAVLAAAALARPDPLRLRAARRWAFGPGR